jgi:MFS family permease
MQAGMPVGLVLGGFLAGWLGAAAAFGFAMVAPLVAVVVAARRVPDLGAASPQRAPSLREVFASLRSNAVAAIATINLVSTFAALGVVLTTLVLIVHDRGIALGRFSDQTSSSAFMGVLIVFMVAVTPIAGRLSDRQRWRARCVLAGLVSMLPGVLLVGEAHSAAVMAAGLAFVGLGMGALTSPLLAMLGDLVPPDMRGSAVGCLQLFGDAGGTLGPVVGASLLATGGNLAFVGTVVLIILTLPVAGWLVWADRAPRA